MLWVLCYSWTVSRDSFLRWAQDVELVHLWVMWDAVVLGHVGSGGGQVGDGLAPDALEVNVPAFPLFLLPGHVNEGALHVIVDHLVAAPWSQLQLLFAGRVAWSAENKH